MVKQLYGLVRVNLIAGKVYHDQAQTMTSGDNPQKMSIPNDQHTSSTQIASISRAERVQRLKKFIKNHKLLVQKLRIAKNRR